MSVPIDFHNHALHRLALFGGLGVAALGTNMALQHNLKKTINNVPRYHPPELDDKAKAKKALIKGVSSIPGIFSGTIGVSTGLATHNPFYGALAGAGAAAVLKAPRLYGEYKDIQQAKDHIDNTKLTASTRNEHHGALNKALVSYGLGQLMYPTLAGGSAGALADNLN